jgi:cyclophilin family peptidyl-prolyl cis-trans isomerase/HEAT repeat protein
MPRCAMKPELLLRLCWLLPLTAACAVRGGGSPEPGQPRLRALPEDAVPAAATLLRFEDQRLTGIGALSSLAAHPSPEVRRRAAMTLGRLRAIEGTGLLRTLLADPDSAVAASAAFALGHLGDTTAVPALAAVLFERPARSESVAAEAAAALGKLRTPAARDALGTILAHSPAGAAERVVGEALLAIWRYPRGPEVDAILPWTAARSPELRWRAAYALTRRPTPAAVPALIQLADDPDGLVRSMAMRGLTGPLADSAGVERSRAEAVLLRGIEDADYRVRISAIRSLGTHPGETAVRALDSLLPRGGHEAITAIEALAAAGQAARASAPRLEAVAADPAAAVALRTAALAALLPLDRPRAESVALRLAGDGSWRVRAAAGRTLAQVGPRGRGELVELLRDPDPRVSGIALEAAVDTAGGATLAPRALLVELVASADPRVRSAALRGLSHLRDAATLPLMLDAYGAAIQAGDTHGALAAIDALGVLASAGVPAANSFFQRFPRPEGFLVRQRAEHVFAEAAVRSWGPAGPIVTGRTADEYARIIVQTAVDPVRAGRFPTAVIETEVGVIVIELFSADAPLTVENFLTLAERGYFDGQEWPRVVPNFVVQGGDPRGDQFGGPGYEIRDEINRHRYLTGTVGMALSGPDTGGSQFFLTHSPQPHLDGGFTVFGRVVSGQEVVERVLAGERIHGVRVSR